eukprot:COSAG01_NODE_3391_length_6151_cov_4.717944_2_plen_125_part_00
MASALVVVGTAHTCNRVVVADADKRDARTEEDDRTVAQKKATSGLRKFQAKLVGFESAALQDNADHLDHDIALTRVELVESLILTVDWVTDMIFAVKLMMIGQVSAMAAPVVERGDEARRGGAA